MILVLEARSYYSVGYYFAEALFFSSDVIFLLTKEISPYQIVLMID
jgi:hypothetical protein